MGISWWKEWNAVQDIVPFLILESTDMAESSGMLQVILADITKPLMYTWILNYPEKQ